MAQNNITEMPAYVGKLTTALEQALPGAAVSHEHVYNDRYRFIVVWDQFHPMGHPDRQDLVWKVVSDTLEGAELVKVSMILAMDVEEAGH